MRRYDVGAPAGITISLPGADSQVTLPHTALYHTESLQDAERRRQIALRALSERLGKAESPASQWPSMDTDQDKPER